MTVLHMVNCCLSAFGPAAVCLSTLSESTNTLRLAALAAAFFLANLVTKSLVLVVLPFPAANVEGFNFSRELVGCLANFVDFGGVTLLLRTRQAAGFELKTRLIFAGLGWALAHSVASNFLPFIIGARGSEFDWDYTYRAVLSNYNLVCQVVFTVLVYISTRKNPYDKARPGIYLSTLIHIVGIPLLTSYGRQKNLSLDQSFAVFMAQFTLLAISAFAVAANYQTHSPSKSKSDN